jgi:hypothetical protein
MSDLDLSFSHFFVPKFGVSALHLKCTKHMGFIAMCISEEYVWEQKGGGLKEFVERV